VVGRPADRAGRRVLRNVSAGTQKKHKFLNGFEAAACCEHFDFFCGDESYVALTLIGDLAKRNFAEKNHII